MIENMTYTDWFALVDECVWAALGCGVVDISDALFRDWYEEGMAPAKAAEKAIFED